MSAAEGPLDAAEALARARAALDGGDAAVGVVVVEGPEDAPPRPGDRVVVTAEGRAGSLGPLDAEAERLAREVLGGAGAGLREVETGDGRWSLYLEAYRAPPALLVVGAGHIARPLCRVGAMLGFRVAVLDDRPEFATRERFPEADAVLRVDWSDPFRGVAVDGSAHVVLVTRGHRYDFEALRDLLRRPVPPAYVGMVGSRRRVRAALAQLAREGVAEERLRAVHAPVGLDVGAETPAEIAVAVAAELVLVRRGGTGVPLRDRERVAERWLERDAGA